jgi:putative inorganic carbon (HCO3(-)) transporter
VRLSSQKFVFGFIALLAAGLISYFFWLDQLVLSLFPIGLILIYFVLYQTEKLFLAIAFFAPLSFNIEEFSQDFGLFIPSEPLLMLLMFFLTALHIKKPFIDPRIWKHPIVFATLAYVGWIFITAITSSHVLVSFKFMLARLWFIVPILIFGTHFFKKESNRIAFFWLFLIGSSITIFYTLIHHAQYNFGEKEGHWVMFPFFKDHTIYGAIVALVLPISVSIFNYKKQIVLVQAVLILITILILVGLYFSYTRAAWLSIIIAVFVGLLVHYKVNFKFLFGVGFSVLIFIFLNWDSIEMELARNKNEHTTESFNERIQSAANVTTDASNLERINRWSCAISMFEQRPIFGFGPGTYAFEYAPFQEPENLTIISTNFGDMGNAHSEYLGVLSEMGVFGLISFLGIVVAIFYSSISLYHQFPVSDKKNRTLVMGMIIALTTYFSHSFLNNFLDTDKAAVPIWGICAMLIVMKLELQPKNKSDYNLTQL